MSDKELQFYNIVLCGVVGGLVSRACNGNILLSFVIIIAVLLLLFKVVKIEKYIKKYLIKWYVKVIYILNIIRTNYKNNWCI
jgi:hypothetical protein